MQRTRLNPSTKRLNRVRKRLSCGNVAVITRRDGREVCTSNYAGRKEYHRRVVVMCIRQNWACSLCGGPMNLGDSATFEHTDGRGMGGGHRDDRTEINGKPYNSAAHGWCNVLKGSRRGSREARA
jgi:hypothetical protein